MVMLIVAIIAGIGVPVILYLHGRTKPQILFTLSDQLRIGQAESGKTWQQITVRNSGRAVAKKIQVKIGTKILEHQIDQHSEADKPDVFDRSDSFELVYPELPTNGTFKLTFATTGSDQIGLENISVSHSTGKGIEAFSRVRFKNLLPILPIIFFGILYLVAASLTWGWSNLDTNASMYPVEKVLKKNKPFYITQAKWLYCRKQALREVLSSEHGYEDITLSKSYQILKDDPPTYLSPEEWRKLKTEAESKVQKNFNYRTMLFYDNMEGLLALLKIDRPENILETTWLKIQKEINDYFLKRMLEKASHRSIEELQQLLKSEKPVELNSEVWQAYTLNVKNKYFEKIESELKYSSEPCILIDKQDLTLLPFEKADELKQKAYELNLKRLPDLRVLSNAKAFLKIPKPGWLKEEDYAEYKETAEKTISAEKIQEEYSEKLKSITAKENELSTKIKQVTSQLEIINQVLNDPDALERIEDYSNSFAPGNFKNLKRIATLNKQQKKEVGK